MKKIILLISGLVFFASQGFAQDNIKENDPDEQIIVNKKYDENGNLIQFDSTYIHQWSSVVDSALEFPFRSDEFFSGSGFPEMQQFFDQFNEGSHWGSMPDIYEMLKQFQDQMSIPDSLFEQRSQRFHSLKQEKEWQELMKKHRKEMDDFWKEWDSQPDENSGFRQ